MNKIHFQEGMALSYEQLAYMQDAIKEALAGLASGVGTNFIVSGCTRTDVDLGILGPGYNYSAGWVVVNGELCQFDGQSIGVSSHPADASFVVNETNVEPQIEFEDSSLKYVYKGRKAIIDNTPGTGNILTFEMLRVNDTWKDIPLLTGVVEVANYTPQYRIKEGFLELRGRAKNESGGTVQYLSDDGTLQVAPLFNQMTGVFSTIAGVFNIQLGTDYKIYVTNWSNNTTILLDGIKFRIL